MILVGAVSGTCSVGFFYEVNNKVSQFEPISDIGNVTKSGTLCLLDPKKFASDCQYVDKIKLAIN